MARNSFCKKEILKKFLSMVQNLFKMSKKFYIHSNEPLQPFTNYKIEISGNQCQFDTPTIVPNFMIVETTEFLIKIKDQKVESITFFIFVER